MVDAQRRRNDSSRAHNPTDLTHADLQLLQLLRLQAHTHDAQAVADAGSQPRSTAAPVRAVLHAGRRQIDLPLPDDMIGQLAIEAHFANMRISDLVVQLIAKALKDPEIVS